MLSPAVRIVHLMISLQFDEIDYVWRFRLGGAGVGGRKKSAGQVFGPKTGLQLVSARHILDALVEMLLVLYDRCGRHWITCTTKCELARFLETIRFIN